MLRFRSPSSAVPGICSRLLQDALSSWSQGLRSPTAWMAWMDAQQLHTSPQAAFISLNTLADNPGATRKGKRVGRGIGSGKGKTSGRGHKGQKARSGNKGLAGFEGGQTPMHIRTPKRGFFNNFSHDWQPLNLSRLQRFIEVGKLDTSAVITMKELRDANVVHKDIKDGVKLLAMGAEDFKTPVHLQVSQCSTAARAAVQAAGGSVETVYYNQLGLRALTQPEWFPKKGRLLPRPARPPPKLVGRFDRIGELPPSREILSSQAQT